jgi:thioredoxin-related protein
LPSLDEAYLQNRDNGLQVLLVNLQEKSTEALSFVEHFKYKSTVLLDSEGEVAKKFHIMGIPTSLLLDKSGKIVFRSNGSVNWKSAKMETLLNQLLDEE